MGHSVSLDRDRSTDLNHFLQVNQQQQQPLPEKAQPYIWTGRRKHLSTLFSLPVDTFVHITRYLPLGRVVQDLTCVHPFLYEIIYHPHNVDALWNGRYLNNEASAVNNDYLMCLDSDTVSSIASFLAKSKLSHFRIHLRQWNEEHLIKVLKAAQSNAIEMHITAFENRLNITQLTKCQSAAADAGTACTPNTDKRRQPTSHSAAVRCQCCYIYMYSLPQFIPAFLNPS